MNPDYAALEARVKQLERLLSFPSDDSVRYALGMPFSRGDGTSPLTQTISIGAGGGSATVPKGFAGSVLMDVAGTVREFPYL